MKNIFFLFLTSFVTIFNAFSQNAPLDQVSIKGTVIDSLTNETIPYATIKIVEKDQPTVTMKVLASDQDGKFQFSINKAGEYTAMINYMGKRTLSLELNIDKEKLIDLGNVKMSENANALSEVVVTADKPLIKADLDKITYSMESDPEAKTNNVLDMLKKVPMITVDGDENIQLKGSSNFRIYLNGKPSNMITNNPKEVLRSMPASTIKEIKVITDPGAKYDAEGVAGIIDIITQKNSSMGGYTATVNSRIDNFGAYGLGGYLSLKQGKIGFTGSYDIGTYNPPKGYFDSYRTDFVNADNRTLTQHGVSDSKYRSQYGSGEFSYEIDSLNLITVSFNRYHSKSKMTNELLIEMLNDRGDTQYKYDRNSHTNNLWGGNDLAADYQRTFHKKDQLLTASYRYSHTPNNTSSDNIINGLGGTLPSDAITNQQFSNGKMNEHTFQLDFSTPFRKIHTLEVGAKYIVRLNASTSGKDTLDTLGNWNRILQISDQFEHQQDIFAMYGGYNVKLKKWGAKVGLRYEGTKLRADYPLAPDHDFGVNYGNLVPSSTLTYQISTAQNMRLGYNMRIMRPNIWQLNPYPDTSDPNNIQQGNSALESVRNHSISLNYSFFNPKLNINLNADYSFDNNGIEQITTIDNQGVSTTTYQNVGKTKNTSINTYINWSGIKNVRIYANGTIRYTDIRANDRFGLSNSGFNGSVFSGIQYNVTKTCMLSGNAGYWGANVNLQGTSASMYFHSFNVSKSYLDNRLTFRVYAYNPFVKYLSFTDRQNTPIFNSESTTKIQRRAFGLSVSFRFGEMKAQIKKVQRTIQNDDNMSGGGQQGQQGGQ